MTDETNAANTAADPYLWLEEVTAERALDWVREQNAITEAGIKNTPRFSAMETEFLEVLDSNDRIAYPRRRGSFLYNFWRDEQNPRGLWRRTTLERFQSEEPEWETLIDVDALSEREGENWVWKSASVLKPAYDRALVKLSRGGADATVVREFNLETKEFITDGFVLPEAKNYVSWIDENRIYVGTDFGPESLTNSGYPRIVKKWLRGTDISEAETVFKGEPDDVLVIGFYDATEGYERSFIERAIDFYNSEYYLLHGENGFVRLDLPSDAQVSSNREWLLIELRSSWNDGQSDYSAGSLLATDLAAFVGGERRMTVLFEPDAHTSLEDYQWTRHHLLLTLLRDVKTELRVLTPETEGKWTSNPLKGAPDTGTVEILDTSPDENDEYFLNSSGYLEPSTLRYGQVNEVPEILKQAPEFFDANPFTVDQYFATSLDGTKIPYFVVHTSSAAASPTLLNGYGGFEVSSTPHYSGLIGRGWLARGGTYVVANIRGGGEYGPHWHSQATKSGRHLVYEDFAAVAQDLIARGITTPEMLGIMGGSNGGLLMGVMLTRYPELFGAIACQVPLLDMSRYHKLLAGASWMAEYGDPDNPEEWAFIEPYSPYHNVHSGQNYPPALFATSTRDDRVHPAHARKMMAKMRQQGHPVWYHENIEGGHGGASDNKQLASKWAMVFEFLWQKLTSERESV
jgi:prolyl oligopeptidase